MLFRSGKKAITALRRHVRQAGRKRRDVGIEGRIRIAGKQPEEWMDELKAWEALGAVGVTVEARRGGLATEIPVIVLINGGSASASEIVAGAIQDRERGVLVGETSFGKGSVQNWIPLSQDGGAIRVTIARWYTPNGRQIGEQGLTPDVIVEVDPESLGPDEDPQLERAIQLLLEMAR